MRIVHRGALINVLDVGDLQEAVNRLPAAGGTLYLPAGEYEIDETVRVNLADKQHFCLHGDGRATVVHFTATDSSHLLELRGVENSWWPDLKITIRDLTLVGSYECGDALHLLWPNDLMVDACFFQGFGGTAIHIGPNATNVTVRDCWMRDCKRMLHADNLHHLTFHGNQTRSMKDGQVQAEHLYIGRHCREVRIVNNHIAYGHAEGIILDGTAQHVVANNTIEGFTHGIRARDCRDILINSNYLHCPTGVLMEGDNRGLTVSGNMFTNNFGGAVVVRDAGGSGAHVISGNVIRQSVYNDGQRGMDLGDASDCIVTGNVFEDLTAGTAVSGVPDLSRHTLSANRVTETTRRVLERDRFDEVIEAEHDNPYRPLYEYFRGLGPESKRVTLTFAQIERALGTALPEAAREHSPWWANDPAAEHARAWLAAGWFVVITKRIEGRIVFARG